MSLLYSLIPKWVFISCLYLCIVLEVNVTFESKVDNWYLSLINFVSIGENEFNSKNLLVTLK